MKFYDVETIAPPAFPVGGREIAFVDALFVSAQRCSQSPSLAQQRAVVQTAKMTRQFYGDIERQRSESLKVPK